MKNKTLSFSIQAIVYFVILFVVHFLIVQVFEQTALWQQSSYSLLQIYFFTALTTLLFTICITVAEKFIAHQLGFVFLILLTLKLVGHYFFINPVLEMGDEQLFIRYNYLIIFLLSIGFDAFVAYKLLNDKK
ncbi:hypothetical protein AB4865_02840 [Capnocytophaga sp. ARDL2]|uniref:hypothetical protein n=1 Tax=Capnocytophaga sp. ARDL2 TaxID=3238809 RepID=UPI0035582128